jgi:hypothetical protein
VVGLAQGSDALQGAAPAGAVLPPAAKQSVDFVTDIQPILAGHCYACHGPEKQKGELRWDTRASVFKGGENGPVLVPGNSSASRVIKLVSGQDPDSVMPPRGERLTEGQIGLLRAWIDQGANWPDSVAVAKAAARKKHWAFKAPVRPAVPAVKRSKWSRNPIDDFVLARLEAEHLKPAPEADRATLIRRLSLDLTGLPPTLKEIDAFLADRRPDAYERLVERLLASPHYGEQWGRHWLDLARYADTNGYEKDRPRSIWPYRDWVIKAFNRDLPFDEFAIEQLAGDLLPNASAEQRVATGFLRNAMLNQEGGIEPEQFRVEALVDRMDTLGKAFLGLTINCCQCHDHKFDPFSQKEYYQLYAFLNQDDEAYMEVPTAEQGRKRTEILGKIEALEDEAMRDTTNLNERLEAWAGKVKSGPAAWTVLDPKDWQNFSTKFEKQDDGSLLGGGALVPGGTMRVSCETSLTNITGFRLEALTNVNLMYGGPGQMERGSFLVKEFTVAVWPLDNTGGTNQVKFARASADMEAPGFGVTNAIDGNTSKGGWTPTRTWERRNQNHCAVFECEKPVGFAGGTHVEFTIHQSFDGETKLDCHMLGCFRLSVTTNAGPLSVDPLSSEQRAWLARPAAERSPEQARTLFDVYRHWDPAFAALNKKVDELWGQWPYPPTTMVLNRRATPRMTHVFKRGDRTRPADEVQAGVPAALNPLPAGAPPNRLGLAEWIVDRRSPTTARAMVNRIWAVYFGQGLVTTPEDFGTRVETPSHPELLDWLACEFMEPKSSSSSFSSSSSAAKRRIEDEDENEDEDELRPWSIKHIQRLIVTSATYRQSSRVTPEIYARDQYDRWLERAPRVRVDGEVVQDIALSVSGLLNPKLGGPSVHPPIPGNVGDTAYEGFTWPETKGPDRYRRGLYTFWKRSLPFPALSAFDVPSGETSCPRRVRSNTPLQALTTLNEATFVEAARAMALRVMKEGGADDRARAQYAFRLCTGRPPSTAELERLMKFLREQYDYFEGRTSAAVEVAVLDTAKLPPDVNLHRAAAWMMLSRAILNLDETITKE